MALWWSGMRSLANNPNRFCHSVDGVKTNKWSWFTDRGWDVCEIPSPMFLQGQRHFCAPSAMKRFFFNAWFATKWVFLNFLSLHKERLAMQKGEENLKMFFTQLGIKPIEVDLSHCHGLGGAFHCWSLDRCQGERDTAGLLLLS
jgi:glycine amidinotransferase